VIPPNQSKPQRNSLLRPNQRGAALPTSNPSKPLSSTCQYLTGGCSETEWSTKQRDVNDSVKCDPDAHEDPRGVDSSDPIRYNRFMFFLPFLSPNNTHHNALFFVIFYSLIFSFSFSLSERQWRWVGIWCWRLHWDSAMGNCDRSFVL